MPSTIKCWVPNCNARQEDNFKCRFFPLPKDPKYREIWLSLTAKPLISEEGVYYCENHFQSYSFDKVMGNIIGLKPWALPYHNMPQMICRTCLTTIERKGYFCVLSGTIPCTAPPELSTELTQSRPEALYHILTFCIPNLNLTQNPPGLVCIKCYHKIWQYFLFKLQSNVIDTNLRGTMSPEEFGKVVLCRCCPETTSRFFELNETQPMGEVLSNIFLSKFPTDIVPLKVCLKCWNVLQKILVFHQKCVAMDELFQRCFELNESQRRNSLLALPSPDQKQLMVPPPAKLKQSTVISDQKHMVKSVVETASPMRFSVGMSEPAASTSKCVNSSVSDSAANCSSDRIRCSDVSAVEAIGEKCSEKRNFDVSQSVTPSGMQANDSPAPVSDSRGKTQTFTGESTKLLVHLVLQHSRLITPNLNSIELAKLDLDMWINVMKGLHDQGYCFTLDYVQSVWRRLKSATKAACGTMGPLSHLDFLVNIYLSRVGRTKRPISTQSEGEKKSGKFVEGEVICLDEDSDVEEPSNVEKTCGVVETLKINKEPTSSCDNKHKEQHTVASTSEAVDVPQSQTQPSTEIPLPKKRVGRPTTKPKIERKKGKMKKRHKVGSWNNAQKLELARAMRQEYKRLLENKELGNYRFTPWKRILESLASKNFENCSFTKLYAMWGKMKVSATIYEKNGMDMVDDEVWDLLKFHDDVHLKLLRSKEGSNKCEAMEKELERADSNHSESAPPKKTKRSGSGSGADSNCSKLNAEHTGRDIIDSTKGHVVGSEVLNLLKRYRHNKKNKQTIPSKDESTSSVPPNTWEVLISSGSMKQPMLDLVSVVRSFGNEVFSKKDTVEQDDFWKRVANRFQPKGLNWNQNELYTIWKAMLHSAKLTWAQEDRTANVGDNEIIDFMTEVIKEKEKNKNDSDLNSSVESDKTEDTSGIEKSAIENPISVVQNVPVETDKTESAGVIVKRESKGSSTQAAVLPNKPTEVAEGAQESAANVSENENNSAGDYDYVSLEDLKVMYGNSVVEPANPVEVIEILDSDEE